MGSEVFLTRRNTGLKMSEHLLASAVYARRTTERLHFLLRLYHLTAEHPFLSVPLSRVAEEMGILLEEARDYGDFWVAQRVCCYPFSDYSDSIGILLSVRANIAHSVLQPRAWSETLLCYPGNCMAHSQEGLLALTEPFYAEQQAATVILHEVYRVLQGTVSHPSGTWELRDRITTLKLRIPVDESLFLRGIVLLLSDRKLAPFCVSRRAREYHWDLEGEELRSSFNPFPDQLYLTPGGCVAAEGLHMDPDTANYGLVSLYEVGLATLSDATGFEPRREQTGPFEPMQFPSASDVHRGFDGDEDDDFIEDDEDLQEEFYSGHGCGVELFPPTDFPAGLRTVPSLGRRLLGAMLESACWGGQPVILFHFGTPDSASWREPSYHRWFCHMTESCFAALESDNAQQPGSPVANLYPRIPVARVAVPGTAKLEQMLSLLSEMGFPVLDQVDLLA